MELATGTAILQRYTVEGPLGRGGMGAMAWRGADRDVRDAATGRVVVELAVLTALVGVPLAAALVALRSLGRVLAGG